MKLKQEVRHSETIAKILHDFKIPVHGQIKALETFLQTTSNKINDDEKDLIKLTLNSCVYVQKLIEMFNSVQKFEKENIKLNYEKFNIVNLTKEIIFENNILLKYYELKLELNNTSEININADKTLIKKAIENILFNIIECAYKNSTIYIDIKQKNSELMYEIKVNSANINSMALNKMFSSNINQITSKKTNNDLYLYFSKEIIHAHFGSMIVKNYTNDINVIGFKL